MDRLTAIRVFVAVADAGSLSAAGRRLGMPLSTVSRHLKALEDELEIRLITRTTRRLTLTAAGRAYAATCRQVLEQLDDATRNLAGEHAEPRGELALTAPALFGRLYVLPVVTAFLAANRQVSARLLLVDRIVDLVEEGLEIGVRIGHLPDSSLRATRLGSIRYVACASPAYLERRGEPSAPSELAGHDCISFNTISHPERWTFGGDRERRVTVAPRLIVNTAEAAIDAAKEGLGIVRVLSYQAEQNLAEGSLRRILGAFEPEPIPVNLIHREDRLPQAKVESFIAFAAPRLRQALKTTTG
ncbi:LysR family transcriptional regulator [Methyloceanibacter sp.]|uniref:LysR family transcriptional regulator n=1 Tax=Methyloceanibacter sp. TaxID=1965321 RepID=UPI002D325CD9|nr:LysR family transcriptional regulator [Methyloceanibacter sp.]HZP10059.1 LysR family transcriptional regulator [Methyloceanibacter sp.]